MFGFGKNKNVKKSNTDEGSHGDHWGAIFGFENPDFLQETVMGYVEKADLTRHSKHIDIIRYIDGQYSVIGLLEKQLLMTAFPALNVDQSLPVNVKEIIEWTHGKGLEAQIIGAGRDTFGLNFFAVDYLWAKEKYEQGGMMDVGLVGICFGLEDSSLPNAEQPDFSEDFCAYLPHPELPDGMYYQFIGDIVSVSDFAIDGAAMKIINIKLIQDPDKPDFFVLPLLVNEKHISGSLDIGMKKSGAFWLQGQLATR